LLISIAAAAEIVVFPTPPGPKKIKIFICLNLLFKTLNFDLSKKALYVEECSHFFSRDFIFEVRIEIFLILSQKLKIFPIFELHLSQ
jgi:hypothetical protein